MNDKKRYVSEEPDKWDCCEIEYEEILSAKIRNVEIKEDNG